jgi:hypothetical protein
MSKVKPPFALPQRIEPSLTRVVVYWEKLKRGQANIPFADDVKVDALPGLADNVLLIDVFEKPFRFRFAAVGRRIVEQHGSDLDGKFVDEFVDREPLDYFFSQCSATVEGHMPTYFQHGLIEKKKKSAGNYARVIFPLWGDGHISMLLGAIAWGKPAGAHSRIPTRSQP